MNAPGVEENSIWCDGKVGAQRLMNGYLTENWTRLKHLTDGKPRDKKKMTDFSDHCDTPFFFLMGRGVILLITTQYTTRL
jgi:hypothetical protein